MANLHDRRQTQVQTRTLIPVLSRNRVLNLNTVCESVSVNVNEPLCLLSNGQIGIFPWEEINI